MNRQTSLFLLTLLSLSMARAAVAGDADKYYIIRVDYERHDSHDGTFEGVWVQAAAEFRGTPGPGNYSWTLETVLVAMGSEAKAHKAGTGASEGLRIDNSPATTYGATKSIPKCTSDSQSNTFKGRASVAVYQQGYDPLTNEGYAPWDETNCDPSSNTGIGGVDEEGGTEPTYPLPDPWCTPILVDLDRSGFDLSDPEQGVQFDIDRDGDLEVVAWTPSDSADGWLTLDRNGNGVVDDGGELFGNFTDQPDSDSPNGYLALGVFDGGPEGGDGNGIIDARDRVFSELRVWVDANHDGISQPGELLDLEEAGIRWLETRPVVSQRRDRFGNELRYQALVRLSLGMSLSADVFVLTDP